eukprot:PhF_6_TR34395/c0_g1_i1/m.50270
MFKLSTSLLTLTKVCGGVFSIAVMYRVLSNVFQKRLKPSHQPKPTSNRKSPLRLNSHSLERSPQLIDDEGVAGEEGNNSEVSTPRSTATNSSICTTAAIQYVGGASADFHYQSDKTFIPTTSVQQGSGNCC